MLFKKTPISTNFQQINMKLQPLWWKYIEIFHPYITLSIAYLSSQETGEAAGFSSFNSLSAQEKKEKKSFPNRWECDFGFSGAVMSTGVYTTLVIYLNLLLEEGMAGSSDLLRVWLLSFQEHLTFLDW